MIRPVRQDLRWCLALVAVAEWAEPALDLHSLTHKICRTLGAVRGNDDPPSYDWVFSQLRQVLNPFSTGSETFILRHRERIFEHFNVGMRGVTHIIHAHNIKTPLRRSWQVPQVITSDSH